MTRTRLDHEFADATGESSRGVRRPGSPVPPGDPAPESLYLVVDCPHCRKAAPYPGQLPDGSSPMAGCPGCDALFDYDILDVYVSATRPG